MRRSFSGPAAIAMIVYAMSLPEHYDIAAELMLSH